MDETLQNGDPDDDEHRARRAALLHVGAPLADAPPWLLTYSDIVAQLVCLLILLLSFAHFVPARFDELQGAVEQTFGRDAENRGRREVQPPEAAPETASASRNRGVLEGLRALVARHSGRLVGGQVDVEVFEDYRGVVLRLGDAALFDPEQAFVRPAAWPLLEAVGAQANAEAARLEIEVRVAPRDGGPPGGDVRLAGARGLAIARYLEGQDAGLDARRLSVRALGTNERAPPLQNARAREIADRVDFVFSRSPLQTESPP
jgi:chemotaxis protein MotB